jgi:hypothetical protein
LKEGYVIVVPLTEGMTAVVFQDRKTLVLTNWKEITRKLREHGLKFHAWVEVWE